MNIQFQMPVDVAMRENCVRERKSAISAYGGRAIILTDRQGAQSGAVDDIAAAMRESGVSFVQCDTAQTYLTAAEMCAFVEKNCRSDPEFVISIGGEFSINTGKAFSLLAAQEDGASAPDLENGRVQSRSLPHIAIPATAGAGSSVTPFMTILSGESRKLTTLRHPALYARMALMDYRYTAAVPWDITVNTAFSAIGCAFEAILSAAGSKFTRVIAQESLANSGAILSALEEDLVDLGIRRMMMYDSALSGIAVSQTCGSGLHSISWLIARDRGIPQGRAVGLFLAPYLHIVWRQKPYLIDKILHAMGFQNLEDFGQKISLLLPGKEAFTPPEIERWAREAVTLPDIQNGAAALSERDIQQILRMV